MKKKASKQKCFACGGTMVHGKTTFTADFGSGVVVIRDVPAMVCSQCGMDLIDDSTAEKLETIVQDAKRKNNVVEVLSLSA